MIQASSRFVYRLSVNYESADITTQEIKKLPTVFVSKGCLERLNRSGLNQEELELLKKQFLEFNGYDAQPTLKEINAIHVDVNIVDGFDLDITAFRRWRKSEFGDSILILENGSINLPGEASNGKYSCGAEVEKMSKSKFNTVNPDDLVAKYGADTFRMYEMFLGPVEMSKPWDTKGIEGVHQVFEKVMEVVF